MKVRWVERAEEAGVLFLSYPLIGLRRYWEEVRRFMGVDGEAILAYESEKEGAKELVMLLSRKWKLETVQFVRALEEFFEELGMGRLIIDYPQQGLRETIVAKVENSYMARHLPERSDRPLCHLIRGHIAGVMEELTGWKMDAEETMCLAMGDEYCEFVARRVEPII